jgi:hypothetical protein
MSASWRKDPFAAVMNFPAAGSKLAHLKSRSRGGVANS